MKQKMTAVLAIDNILHNTMVLVMKRSIVIHIIWLCIYGTGSICAQGETFDVILKNPGAKKLQVIKAIREINNMSLEEAKHIVSAAPKTVKDGASRVQAERIRKTLEDIGAKVDIQKDNDSIVQGRKYRIILEDSGPNKDDVVKKVRTITELGAKESQGLVDDLPSVIKEGASSDEALKISKMLEAVGAQVDIEYQRPVIRLPPMPGSAPAPAPAQGPPALYWKSQSLNVSNMQNAVSFAQAAMAKQGLRDIEKAGWGVSGLSKHSRVAIACMKVDGKMTAIVMAGGADAKELVQGLADRLEKMHPID